MVYPYNQAIALLLKGFLLQNLAQILRQYPFYHFSIYWGFLQPVASSDRCFFATVFVTEK